MSFSWGLSSLQCHEKSYHFCHLSGLVSRDIYENILSHCLHHLVMVPAKMPFSPRFQAATRDVPFERPQQEILAFPRCSGFRAGKNNIECSNQKLNAFEFCMPYSTAPVLCYCMLDCLIPPCPCFLLLRSNDLLAETSSSAGLAFCWTICCLVFP